MNGTMIRMGIKLNGQTLIEYALLIMLIAVVVILVLQALGIEVFDMFETVRGSFGT